MGTDVPRPVAESGGTPSKRGTGEPACAEPLPVGADLVDDLPGLVWVETPPGQRVLFNRAWLELTGRSLAAERGRGWLEGVHPADRSGCLPGARSGGAPPDGAPREYRLKDRAGSYRWLLETSRSLPAHAGRPAGRVGSAIDITARREREQALRQSEERLRRAERVARMGCWDWDIVTNSLFWTEEIYRIFGLSPESFGATYEAFLASVHPDDRARVQFRVDAAVNERAAYEIEHRVVLPSGEIRWVQEQGSVERDAAGRAIRMIGTVLDITERVRDREAIRRSAERYRDIFESAGVAIWEEDLSEVKAILDGLRTEGVSDFRSYFDAHPEVVQRCAVVLRVLDVNRAAVEMFAAGSKDDLLAEISRTFLPESFDVFREELLVIAEGGTRFSSEARLQTLDGRPFDLLIELAIPPEGADFSHLLVSMVDNTERRLAHEALEARVAERTAALRETNRELEGFAYTVSHDLRAPLRALQGFSNALLEDCGPSLSEEGREYAGRIAAAAERMDALIRDLLAYSRLSRSDLELHPLELDPVLQEARERVEEELRRRSAELRAGSELGVVRGHRATLVQVLANLLANAVKFVAKDRRPRVAVAAERRGAMVRVFVEDNGIGVATQHRERIFGVFERLHGREAYPGTGIGLAIVKKGVERMGGKAGMEPRVGGGSRFWFELPAGEAH